jgi:protein-S-isoprenylcysteine O-methyltransferase Ste14
MDLTAFFALYFVLAFVWRGVTVYRRTGVNPLVLPRRDDAHGYIGRAFKVVLIGVAALLAAETFSPGGVHRFGQADLLDTPIARVLGWTVLWASLVWLVIAQAQMGNSWRVGIDEARTTDLVTRGVFGWSRNPIFLGLRVTLAGLILVLPFGSTLALAVAAEVLIQVQVRLEETHLRALHGDRYEAYVRRVRRWA